MSSRRVIIIGGGIGGLTLALLLQRAGIECEVLEAAPDIKPLGVGINILPQASAVLCGTLGLGSALAERAVLTQEASFFNRFGQLILTEPLGRSAGEDWPQFSIHRGDLHQVLLDAAFDRLGAERIHLGCRCTGFAQDSTSVRASCVDARSGAEMEPRRADALVGCDGLHSVVRRQFASRRGRAALLRRQHVAWGNALAAHPVGRHDDSCRVVHARKARRLSDSPQRGCPGAPARELARRDQDPGAQRPRLESEGQCRGWRFDWLGVPAFISSADLILEFPMIDQDPLPFWTDGRVTLLGDAAHPMYPRGSNGAGQAVLDAQSLATELARTPEWRHGLRIYERTRLPATANVVRMTRTNPPDAILREVYERTGDRPFARIEDVISRSEMMNLLATYRRATAGQPS